MIIKDTIAKIKNESRPCPLSYKYPPMNEADIPPSPWHAQDKLYKSYAPFMGSILYYITQIPSITTSIKHEQNDTIKNKKIKVYLSWNL